MKKLNLFLSLLFFLGFSNPIFAQNWDFQKYPKLDISLQHLNADIHIDEFGVIEGDVLYRATANIDNPDSLVFDASRLNILSVSVNDVDKDFMASNDQLVIYLDQLFEKESVLNIQIQYEANPVHGVLRNVNRTTWTSQLPKTTNHWLPVIDHPRAEFTTELIVTHPSGHTFIASGQRTESEVVSVDEERTSYRSTIPIPASSLSWVVGELIEQSSIDIRRFRNSNMQSQINVRVYSESDLIPEADLAQLAANTIQSVREELNSPFPFNNLDIVVLDNDYWETKSYAAGMVFVYQDRGDMEQQIQRGILSQWIGIQIREEQWSDADAIHSAHAILGNLLFDLDPMRETNIEPYNIFSLYAFSKWSDFFSENQVPRFKESLLKSVKNMLEADRNILSWNTLSELIYNDSGQPYFDGFLPEQLEITQKDTVVYSANVEWDEIDNTVQINFAAENQVVDELVTVVAEEITFQGTNQHELTFTGESESSVIRVSPGIENLKLTIDGRDDLVLIVQKPFMFWINQLRNDMEPENRIRAARGLANYTDNPDLQLAMNDILRVESNPEVYAEIVRSLAEITDGAAGMDQRFLEYSSSQQHSKVRIAAVEALADFPNNEQVIGRLQSIIVQSGVGELQKTAIQSLAAVTEAERFNSIVNNLISRESVLVHVPLMLQLLAEKGEPESAVEMASTFITEQFPYEIQKQALDILLQYDRSPSNWEERLPDLLTDTHPRIRYEAVSALEFLDRQSRRNLAGQFLTEEYDARVKGALMEYQ